MSVVTRSLFFALGIVAVIVGIAIVVAQRKQSRLNTSLPNFPGRVEVELHCLKCHDAQYLLDHGQDLSGWNASIDRMKARGFFTASDATVHAIANYLAAFAPAH